MEYEEGQAAVMNALAYAEEHYEDPVLLTIAIVLTIQDADDETHVVTHTCVMEH